MMLKLRFSILMVALLFCNFCNAQNTTFTGEVTDKKTGQMIPYVTVNLSVEKVYSRADENGNFKIHSAKSFSHDSLSFTSVGYLPFKIAVKDINGEVKVALTEDIKLLKEVAINKRTEMVLGRYTKPRFKSYEGASMITRRFMKEDDFSYLKSISIWRKTDKLSGKGKAKFRIVVFNSESNTGPPNGVVYEQILVDDTKEEVIEVDLSKYHILLPTNFFFVGVERINSVDRKALDPKIYTGRDHQHSWAKLFDDTSWQKIYHRPAITATVL